MLKRLVILLAFLPVSCSYYSPIYWGWGEWNGIDPAAPKTDMVQLDWHKLPGVIKTIDGNNLGDGYKKAKLVAGRHVLEYAYYTAGFGIHPSGKIEIEMTAGHTYEFKAKLCFWCKPRKYAVWIDDKHAGELAWGKRPDWSSLHF
jgi:hypothetical protein